MQPTAPPGPRYPRPLQTLGWITRPGPWLERCQQKYGDMFSIRIANEGTWVMLSDPDAVKQVFTGDPNVLHAGEGNAILEPIVGPNSVLLLDRGAHMSQRKLMLPSFHGERMKNYGQLMTDIADAEVSTWRSGPPMALHPRMQAITLEIILRAVFGVREGVRLDELRQSLATMMDEAANPRGLAVMSLLGPDRATKLPWWKKLMGGVDELVYREITAHRADPDLESRDDILSLLLQASHEDGSPMTDVELRDELMTLLVAGHETTATSLSWALERLLRHPELLDRLQEEVAAGGEELLDAVVKETLRLRPVLPLVVRMLKEPMEIGGRMLPAGVRAAPCIYLMHRRPDIYPDPLAFRPDRFIEKPAGTYTWIPFGGGVRRCLGASFAIFEMKAVLRSVMAGVELAPSRPVSERVRRRSITLTPEHGAEVLVGATA